MKATPPSQAVPGRTYRVETTSFSSFTARFVRFNDGCCVLFARAGNPFYAVPVGMLKRMERV